MSAPEADNSSFDAKEELSSLLRALKKEQFVEPLLESPYASIDSIVGLDANDIGQLPIPKMAARVVKKTVDETEELRVCLRGAHKTKYYGDLLQAGVRSLEDLIEKGTGDASSSSLPLPKMVSRVLLKRAATMIQVRDLRAFLNSIQKEQYLDELVTKLGITKPEDIRDSTPEKLAAVLPKMVSKIVYKHACQVCLPDDPEYGRFHRLDETTRQQVVALWKILSGSHKSFGTEFYRTLLKLDAVAAACFDGVNLETIGLDFDNMMEALVQDLDKFSARRNQLVARLTRYHIPAQTLWLGVDAFETAAVLLQPELEVLYDLAPWRLFYFCIIPPLHPSILKTIEVQECLPESACCHELQGNSFATILVDWFARNGHAFISRFLAQQRTEFGHKLVQCVATFNAWQKGSGNWSTFKDAMNSLLEGIQAKELQELLLIETARAIEDLMPTETAQALEGVLLAGGIALFGEASIVGTYRSVQRDSVFDQWDQIYRFADKECGERVYELFTADHYGKAMFSRTNMTKQRENFIHQLHVTLLRIHGGNIEDAKPILIEVGHRHRKYHKIESKALQMFSGAMKTAVADMLGRTIWRRRTSDAWAFVLFGVMERYMTVGWACGSSQKSQILNWQVLRRFRDANRQVFSAFFQHFANSLAGANLIHQATDGFSAVCAPGTSSAACLSMSAVEQILDEPDALAAADRVQGLARRHRMFHGVTIDEINKGGKLWMRVAEQTFGEKFDLDLKLQWARFWDLLASSFSHEKDDVIYFEESVHNITEVEAKADHDPPVLTLKKRINYPGGIATLHFTSNKPVRQRAGQFVKIRMQIYGRTVSRFYSVASAPDLNDTATELEFLVKEVEEGKMSPFLVNRITAECEVQVLTTAGSFALPDDVNGCRRIMISAGVGIVAFISAVRSLAKMCEAKLINKQAHLSLIHSERDFTLLPVLEELVELSRTYNRDHEFFRFDLTLCITGKELDAPVLETFQSKCLRLYRDRVSADIFTSSLNEFAEPSKTPMYACGPRAFQKMVRETFLKDFGHPRELVHLEFFDL